MLETYANEIIGAAIVSIISGFAGWAMEHIKTRGFLKVIDKSALHNETFVKTALEAGLKDFAGYLDKKLLK